MAVKTAKRATKRRKGGDEVIDGKFKEEKADEKKPEGSKALVVREPDTTPQAISQWRPEFAKADVDRAIVQVEEKHRFFDNVMKVGAHYAIIPGQKPTPRIDQNTGEQAKDKDGKLLWDKPKPALLKPGAELLNAAMGLHPALEDEYPPVFDIRDDGELFIQFRRVCRIYRQTGPGENDRMLVAQASGECNSWEPKYRYRGSAGRVCPACGSKAIIKGNPKYAPTVDGKRGAPVLPGYEQGGWLCWKKKDGCGTTYPDNDARLKDQQQEREKNPDPMGIANTLLKMADKRALVAATLIATGCSDLFTQDMEESAAGDAGVVIGGGAPTLTQTDDEDPGPPSDAANAPQPSKAPEAPKATQAQSKGESIADYSKLEGWENLRLFHRFGVEHGDDPRVKLFRQFMNDHGLKTWGDLAAVWDTKCPIEKDKAGDKLIREEMMTLIMPLGAKPDAPLGVPAGAP